MKTPHGLLEIKLEFGDAKDPNFERDQLARIELPYPLIYDGTLVHRTRCHKKLVEKFLWVFEQIQAAGLEDECKNYGGIYNNRSVRGGLRPSTHSWGIAIDLEPQKYPLGSTARMPDPVVAIWRAAGFAYGGDFAHRPDPMHFQFATGY